MIPSKYFDKRIIEIRKIMEKKSINLAILTKSESIYYFSGFNPILFSNPVYVIIPLYGDPVLLTHSLRYNHAVEESHIKKIYTYGKWSDNIGLDLNPINSLVVIIKNLGIKNIKLALELSSITYLNYRKITDKININEVSDITHEIQKIRMIKDNLELDLLKKSAAIADIGMEEMLESLAKGRTEAESCTNAQFAMRKLWQKDYYQYEISGFGSSEGGIIDAFDTWCLSGKRISYGCDCPKNYYPKNNEFIKTFVWSKLGGYHVENERTVYKDKIDEEKKYAYDTILEIREKIFQVLKPGIPYEYLYVDTIRMLKSKGFGDMLPGRIGHGIGLSPHEYPSIEKGNKILIKEGMVFTIEPGIYSSKWGGVAHSDTVYITKDGFEFLTKTKRDSIKLI